MVQKPLFRSQRQLSIIAILIVTIATPATVALSYYHLTGDPTFRPLALSVERLVAVGQTVDHIDVQAVITSDGSLEGRLRSERLGERIEKAFYGKGLRSHVRVHPEPTTGPPQIFFLVAGTRLGPFIPARAPQGVRIASEAAAIKKDSAKRSSAYDW